ncbi:tubby-like protein 8 [Nicotiana tabacum]|uniref:Tubby-like protein 8 n=1 Tax=Nicotiana tabacum TaxID=4097 RepID=A0AC58T400_TOBAC
MKCSVRCSILQLRFSIKPKNRSFHRGYSFLGGLPTYWEEHIDKVNQLFSKIPHYNKVSRQYKLDFRDRGRAGLRIQSSVKNFQLTMEKNGRHTILQLGRVGKSKYVMDYRYPLTGYQAFCICLATIDSKLCCTLCMPRNSSRTGELFEAFSDPEKAFKALNRAHKKDKRQ